MWCKKSNYATHKFTIQYVMMCFGNYVFLLLSKGFFWHYPLMDAVVHLFALNSEQHIQLY